MEGVTAAKHAFNAACAAGNDSASRHSMPADSSPKIHNVLDFATELDAFATEHELIGPPPGRAVRAPLARDFQFRFEPMPEPVAAVRHERGRRLRAVILLALLGAVASAAYRYQSIHLIDLSTTGAWAARVASAAKASVLRPAAAPAKPRPNDATPTDPLAASNDSSVSPTSDRTADTRTNTSDVAATDAARPAAARPERAGTSTSLVRDR